MHRQDGIAECGALTGAEAGKRPFRPRRALRALADGYANGALRALAAYAALALQPQLSSTNFAH